MTKSIRQYCSGTIRLLLLLLALALFGILSGHLTASAASYRTVDKAAGLEVRYVNNEWRTFDGDEPVNYTGVANNAAGWWYCKNGVVDFSYTGIQPNEAGWWRIVSGKVDFSCNTVEHNEAGWWKCRNGKVDFSCNSIEYNAAGWWKCKNGKVDFDYNQIGYNDAGWWKCSHGKVDFSYTGVWYNDAGWWYCRNGKVDFGFNGLGQNEAGVWYCRGGKVDFGYSGTITYNGVRYTIQNGKLTGLSGGIFNITFDGNGATAGGMNGMTVYGAATLPANGFAKNGCTFGGWRTGCWMPNILNGTSAPYSIGSGSKNGLWKNSAWRSASTNDGSRTTEAISGAPAIGITRGFRLVGSNHTDVAQDQVPLTAGRVYTLSCYIKGSGQLRLQIGSSAKSAYKTYLQKVTGSWTRASMTFVASDSIIQNGTVSVYFGTRGASNNFLVCGPKLEEYGSATGYQEKGRSESWFADQSVVSGLGSNGQTVTLFALWNPIVYTVNFNANGGTGSMAPQKMVVGHADSLENYSVSRNGYIFRGWNTKPDGTGTHYGNQASVKNLRTDGGSITLYAEWTKSIGVLSGSKILTMYPGSTGKSIKSAQGSVVVEKNGVKYAVVCFVRNSASYLQGNTSDYDSSVVMYNLSTGKVVRSVSGLRLDHANGMCYNPWNGHFYICKYGDISWQSGIAELDWNLNLVNTHEVSGYPHLGAITWSNGNYYCLNSMGGGQYQVVQTDANFNVRNVSGVLSGYEDKFIPQGITTDGSHLYMVSVDQNDPYWRSRQRLNVYDMNGNLEGLGTIGVSTEVEDLTNLNGTFYFTTNVSQSSELYLVSS